MKLCDHIEPVCCVRISCRRDCANNHKSQERPAGRIDCCKGWESVWIAEGRGCLQANGATRGDGKSRASCPVRVDAGGKQRMPADSRIQGLLQRIQIEFEAAMKTQAKEKIHRMVGSPIE